VALSTSSQGSVNANINVTPMADVMLVLLIIFMITAPLIASGFQAQMPQGINLIKAEEQNDDVVLGVDRQGKLYLNTRPYPDEEQVLTTLTEIFAARTKDKILYLNADNQVRMERIQQVVALARRAGVRVLSAVTEQRLGTEPTVSQERAR
jgi:biopolymer transport protein ExbD